LNPKTRSIRIYAILALIWILMGAWQILEHTRVRQRARMTLLDRAKDISTSIGVVLRSQFRFRFIAEDRLTDALEELVKSKELLGVALLNSVGTTVASAGESIQITPGQFPGKKDEWLRDSVIITNIVDIGITLRDGTTTRTVPIIMKRPERPPSSPSSPPPPEDRPTSLTRKMSQDWRHKRPRDRDHRRLRRPPWLSEEEYKDILEKQSLHGFVLKMTLEAYYTECSRDLWLRIAVIIITLFAALGIGVAWRSFERSENLRIRLVKATELNRHLKELNIAAAGLAHETRNPLNLVRGQAQIISRDANIPPELKSQASRIVEEVDRVTNRLSEFINYSRPATPRPVPVKLHDVISDVKRTLAGDMEEKSIELKIRGPAITVEADEALLRQVLFNLVLNAIQAIEKEGAIQVIIGEAAWGETSIEVRDNGPGISPENNEEVFRPYFTTRKEGIGLGLAEVRRIVQAHKWEINHEPAENRGTVFRISGLKIIRSSK